LKAEVVNEGEQALAVGRVPSVGKRNACHETAGVREPPADEGHGPKDQVLRSALVQIANRRYARIGVRPTELLPQVATVSVCMIDGDSGIDGRHGRASRLELSFDGMGAGDDRVGESPCQGDQASSSETPARRLAPIALVEDLRRVDDGGYALEAGSDKRRREHSGNDDCEVHAPLAKVPSEEQNVLRERPCGAGPAHRPG
jgi:hypothetical protein